MSEDYFEKFLEEKFSNLQSKIENNHKSVQIQLRTISADVAKLKTSDESHYALCPNNKKIENLGNDVIKINENIADVSFIRKHPKLSFMALAVALLVFFVLIFRWSVEFDALTKSIQSSKISVTK